MENLPGLRPLGFWTRIFLSFVVNIYGFASQISAYRSNDPISESFSKINWVFHCHTCLLSRERLPGREVARRQTPGPLRRPDEEEFAFSRRVDGQMLFRLICTSCDAMRGSTSFFTRRDEKYNPFSARIGSGFEALVSVGLLSQPALNVSRPEYDT